jgi:hypothetical protein
MDKEDSGAKTLDGELRRHFRDWAWSAISKQALSVKWILKKWYRTSKNTDVA